MLEGSISEYLLVADGRTHARQRNDVVGKKFLEVIRLLVFQCSWPLALACMRRTAKRNDAPRSLHVLKYASHRVLKTGHLHGFNFDLSFRCTPDA